MGLFDTIAGAVGSALEQGDQTGDGAKSIIGNLLRQGGVGESSGVIGQLLNGVGGAQGTGGGMAATLETLAANGLASQVGSWLSNNSNIPVSPEQLRDALGSDQVQQMAQASGLPIGDFLKHLAEHLPVAASEAAGAPTDSPT